MTGFDSTSKWNRTTGVYLFVQRSGKMDMEGASGEAKDDGTIRKQEEDFTDRSVLEIMISSDIHSMRACGC